MSRSFPRPPQWLIRTALLLTLFFLCFISAFRHPWISYTDCLNNPRECEGKLITHFHEPIIGTLYGDGFELLQKNLPSVRVLTDTAGLVQGEYLALSAVFHDGQPLEALNLEMAEGRRGKMIVSVLPVFFVPILWFRYFRWNRKNRFWEHRNHA